MSAKLSDAEHSPQSGEASRLTGSMGFALMSHDLKKLWLLPFLPLLWAGDRGVLANELPPFFLTEWGTVSLSVPLGIAVDQGGFIYVLDFRRDRLKKYSSAGELVDRWGSDGRGPGEFRGPRGLAVDGTGNLYVADSLNSRIQKFTKDGLYLTQWGSPGVGPGELGNPQGVAVDGAGNVYVVDAGNARIQKFTDNGRYLTHWGTNGKGDGQVRSPVGVAVDGAGNVYVADTLNSRIQKFTGEGLFLTQWTGPLLHTPTGMAVDGAGNVYVSQWNSFGFDNPTYKFKSDGRFLFRWGPPGTGSGETRGAWGVAVDTEGHVYLADSLNDRIQKFASDGSFLLEFGNEREDLIKRPYRVAVDDSRGVVYVIDQRFGRVPRFSKDGTPLGRVVAGGRGIAVDQDGSVFLSQDHRILKVDSEGVLLTEWGSSGIGAGQFRSPTGVAVDREGNVYVADKDNNRVQKFDEEGAFLSQWGTLGLGDGELSRPSDLAVDGGGNVYVADLGNERIQKFTDSGAYLAQWRAPDLAEDERWNAPGLGLDSAGNVYVADRGRHRILKFDREGELLSQWGARGNGAGEFFEPMDVAVDREGDIYVADYFNERAQKFRPYCFQNEAALCLNGGRFRVELEWRDFRGNMGSGRVAPLRTGDSGVFWFFDSGNWEMLVKVLDGCGLNGRFWVFSAATTNVQYALRVTDVLARESRIYVNGLGEAGSALLDTKAFDTCASSAELGKVKISRASSVATTRTTPFFGAPRRLRSQTFAEAAGCVTSPENLCLADGRFRVEVEWQGFEGVSGRGGVVPFSAAESGIFWFFDKDNWEMLVKVLDGCSLNDRIWVFAVALTNVEYVLRVTDTETGAVVEYFNELGAVARPIMDTRAFAVCE